MYFFGGIMPEEMILVLVAICNLATQVNSYLFFAPPRIFCKFCLQKNTIYGVSKGHHVLWWWDWEVKPPKFD